MILLILSAPLSFGQSNAQYLKKADDFVRDFLSDLNNIYDSTLATPEYKRTVSNRILNVIMESRDSTILYDNLSMQVIKNNRLNAQKYMDNYLFILQARLDEWSTRYVVRNTMADFKEDTVYLDHTGQHVISKLSRIIRVDFANGLEKRKHRSDTISFYVKFVNKDLYERRIISSDKYIAKQDEPKLDTDGDGIPNEKDKCLLIPGVEYCDGCPDSDSDGVCDKMDECPSEKGVDLCKGCPDSDSDGVCDKEDKCPTQKGPAANFGCPKKIPTPKLDTPTLSFPEIIIPVSISVKELTIRRKHNFFFEYSANFTTNYKSDVVGDFNGEEKLLLKITILPDREKNKKYAKFDLLEILMNETHSITVNKISIEESLDTEMEYINFEYKIDLNKEKVLLEYLKSIKK